MFPNYSELEGVNQLSVVGYGFISGLPVSFGILSQFQIFFFKYMIKFSQG